MMAREALEYAALIHRKKRFKKAQPAVPPSDQIFPDAYRHAPVQARAKRKPTVDVRTTIDTE